MMGSDGKGGSGEAGDMLHFELDKKAAEGKKWQSCSGPTANQRPLTLDQNLDFPI